MINLVTVCGHNTTMLRHMLNHYKDIVDDIFVVVYLCSQGCLFPAWGLDTPSPWSVKCSWVDSLALR